MVRAHALVVEDDEGHATIAIESLRGVAFVTRALTGGEALGVIRVMLPDVVVTDLREVGAGCSPIDYVAQLRVALDASAERLRAPRVPVIVSSGVDPSVQRAIAASLVGVHALPKPYSPRALRALVESLTAPCSGAHPEG